MTRQLSIWLAWVLASAAAGVFLGSEAEPTDLLTFLVVTGVVVGVAQWLVLRRQLPHAGWWILASALSWILVSIVVITLNVIVNHILMTVPPIMIFSPIVLFTLYGAALGAAQWLVLRHHTQRAGWWVLASIVGKVVGWAAGEACSAILFGDGTSTHWAINGAVTSGVDWAVHGAVTGIVLVWLIL